MRMRTILPAAIALAAAFWFWKTTTPSDNVPACTWRIGTGTDIRQGQNYDDLFGDSPVRLSFRAFESRYVYVFSHSAEDGTLLLFPSPAIDSDCGNPLPVGQSVLPGKLADKELAWTTRNGIRAVTTYMVIASSTKITELEDRLDEFRRWSNTVFPDHSMAVTKPGGDVEVLGKPHEAIPLPLLRAAADIGNAEPDPNGPMKVAAGWPGVFVSSWKVRERRTPPAAKPAGENK